MRQLLGWAVLFLVGCLQGCAPLTSSAESLLAPFTGARYTQKLDNEGIVAIPANSPEYRARALALIERHVGSEYEIVAENYVVKGSARELENRSTEDPDKEYQIHYRKLGWRRGADFWPELSLPAPGLGYVMRDDEKGVVAVASKQHRAEALELIEKHLGSDYVIVSEESRYSNYYLFYYRRNLKDEHPGWKPMWSRWGDEKKEHPGWYKGGLS